MPSTASKSLHWQVTSLIKKAMALAEAEAHALANANENATPATPTMHTHDRCHTNNPSQNNPMYETINWTPNPDPTSWPMRTNKSKSKGDCMAQMRDAMIGKQFNAPKLPQSQ